MMLALLLKYRAPIAAALALAALFGWHRHQVSAADRQGYARAQAEGKAAIAELDKQTAVREAEEREISRAHEQSALESRNALQARIDDLSRRALDLGRLRACADRSRTAPARAPGSAPVAHGVAGEPEHGLPAGGADRSGLGVQLVQYAGACEAIRLRLIELQSWVAETR